jgi:hypothetical protein
VILSVFKIGYFGCIKYAYDIFMSQLAGECDFTENILPGG